MGKYDMKKKPEKKSSSLPIWVAGGCVIAAAALIVVLGLLRNGTPIVPPSTTAPVQTTAPIQTNPQEQTDPAESTEPTTAPTQSTETTEPEQTTRLDGDLVITDMGPYAGIYMEDGSDEIVSNVMMLVVRNDGASDLQLARISLYFSSYTAQFEVTNLPAGESVVLLEKNRLPYESSNYLRAEAYNVLHFPAPMSLMEDQFEITGGSGYITVKNISGQDIHGNVFLYYKNSASDLLYGGITYRARISDGIKAGETLRVSTGHYHDGASRLLMVTSGE